MTEELTLRPLRIKGKVPSELKGVLIRNGPARFKAGGRMVSHWFDGLAMLHAFYFQDEGVFYTNRFLRTDPYHQMVDKGKINFLGFMADPCTSLFKRLMTYFFPIGRSELPNANVNVAKYADSYVALTEAPLPVSFDLKTLKTLGPFRFSDRLPQANCWDCAHPHVEGGDVYSMLLKMGRQGTYVLHRMAKGSNERMSIAEIPVKEPSYMHSFSKTKNYLIFTEYPFRFRPIDLLLKGKGFIDHFTWRDGEPTRFWVIKRATGEVVGQYETDPFFAFHHVNAFEKEGRLIVDIITYPDASVIPTIGAFISHPEYSATLTTHLSRYTLDLASKKIAREQLASTHLELPRIHSQKYDGLPYRYLYGVDPRPHVDLADVRYLYKWDHEKKEMLTWKETGCYPGEGVFVAKSEGKAEDDGYLLSVVLQEVTQSSFLLILDARDFKEVARCEVEDHPILQGLHGCFFDDSLS